MECRKYNPGDGTPIITQRPPPSAPSGPPAVLHRPRPSPPHRGHDPALRTSLRNQPRSHRDGPSRARRPRPPLRPSPRSISPADLRRIEDIISPALLPSPAAAPPRPNKCPPPSAPTQALKPQGPALADKHPLRLRRRHGHSNAGPAVLRRAR